MLWFSNCVLWCPRAPGKFTGVPWGGLFLLAVPGTAILNCVVSRAIQDGGTQESREKVEPEQGAVTAVILGTLGQYLNTVKAPCLWISITQLSQLFKRTSSRYTMDHLSVDGPPPTTLPWAMSQQEQVLLHGWGKRPWIWSLWICRKASTGSKPILAVNDVSRCFCVCWNLCSRTIPIWGKPGEFQRGVSLGESITSGDTQFTTRKEMNSSSSMSLHHMIQKIYPGMQCKLIAMAAAQPAGCRKLQHPWNMPKDPWVHF